MHRYLSFLFLLCLSLLLGGCVTTGGDAGSSDELVLNDEGRVVIVGKVEHVVMDPWTLPPTRMPSGEVRAIKGQGYLEVKLIEPEQVEGMYKSFPFVQRDGLPVDPSLWRKTLVFQAEVDPLVIQSMPAESDGVPERVTPVESLKNIQILQRPGQNGPYSKY